MNNLLNKNISWIDVTPIFDAAMGPDNVTLLNLGYAKEFLLIRLAHSLWGHFVVSNLWTQLFF